jgi:hypothetical protein
LVQSFLGQIARRPLRPAKNEAEDRLTELFAAVLAHPECDGLAVFIVRGWLDSAINEDRPSNRSALGLLREQLGTGEWRVRVRTQSVVSVGTRRRRPDLELAFESCGRPDLVIWVEVKLGTGPGRRQLHDYVIAQQQFRIASRGAVVLVAPRSGYEWFDANEIPSEVPRLTWQRTGALLASFTTTTEVGTFLVHEFCDYLREEGLMDPDRLTAEHLVAFAHHKEAFEALELVCSAAISDVAQMWGPLAPEQYNSRYGNTSWWMFPTSRPGGTPVAAREFELDLFRDSSSCFRDGRPGVPVFTVGTSGEPGTVSTIDPETADELTRAGFQLLPKASLLSNSWDRIWRRAYPDELLAGATLEEQGKSLARWVVDAFERLQAILLAGRTS